MLFCAIQLSFAQQDSTAADEETIASNNRCLKCHSNPVYEVMSMDSSVTLKRKMCSNLVITPERYYKSVHKVFKCTDCHSADYDTVPHPGQLKFEPKNACIDCHGGDENFAKYSFEAIEAEFMESVHSSRHSDVFSCWSCHDAHSYKINIRNRQQDLGKSIAYDNGICLNCHANSDEYHLIADKENPNILAKHEWLPNQANHFRNVRCIECHAAVNDSILVAHKIQPKSKAVRRCVECHSQNSLLLTSLYRYQVREGRNQQGFFNGTILSDSYIIGVNRNYYLNVASFVVLILTLIGITIHIIFRIKSK